MYIPTGVIVPLFIISFIMLAFQYYRNDPVRRILNLQFGLMLGAIVLMFAAITLEQLSLIFFALALVWLGLSAYLFRFLVPPRH